jgi:hypothetical protein
MSMRSQLAGCGAVAAAIAAVAAADQPAVAPAPAPSVTPPGAVATTVIPVDDSAALPPIRFLGGVAGDELYNRLLQAPRFKKMSREVYGSPIELRVYQRVHTTRGNRVGGTVTGLLAATTLGLFPAVFSGEHSVVYEYYVHGVLLTSYSYSKQLSRSTHLWGANDTTHGLGKDGLEWAKSTTDLFLKDSAADAKLAQLVSEYRSYFGS